MGRGGSPLRFPPRADRGRAARVLYDPSLGDADEHVALTMRAASVGGHVGEPFADVLGLLVTCPSQDHGRPALRQGRGATFKQIAYIAHLFGMDKAQRAAWYDLARSVPLSEQHAHHLISRLKRREAA